MPDGSVTALEVTQHVVFAREQQRGEFDKRSWQFSELQSDWFADVVQTASVRRLHELLPGLLEQLERQGARKPMLTHAALRVPDEAIGIIDKGLAQLGVLSCRSYESDAPCGSIYLDPLVEPTSSDVDSAAEVVTRHALRAKDNARKLGLTSSATERHLLIWVDHAALDARAAMEHGERHQQHPSEVPELPDEIDIAWLALSVVNPIVWRLDHTRWQTLGRIEESEPIEYATSASGAQPTRPRDA
ncbi:hypothetical protein [Candidatus Poriferisodalis sp.]|uniref:hypothetical protein n=1 Tax=Candidatus Poriferisodalis sp. TaxID=3101277 RepID=UPI003C6FC784